VHASLKLRSLRVILAALAVLLCVPAGALAHGDASTHYLETGNLYPAFGKRPSQAVELQLMGLMDATTKVGYPMKLSLLGDESDVMDYPEMLRTPQRYADKIAGMLRSSSVPMVGPVLVVSPYGIGIAGQGVSRGNAKHALAGINVPPGATGDQLAETAMTAVRQVAEASGHTLPANVPAVQVPIVKQVPVSGPGYDFSGLTPFAVFIAIFGSAVVYVQIRSRMARRQSLRGVA
jgi:hypothetical protein